MNNGLICDLDLLTPRRVPAPAPAPTFSKEKVAEAMEEFHKNVLVLSEGTKKSGKSPSEGFEGISHTALLDWKRCGVIIENKLYNADSHRGVNNALAEGDSGTIQAMAAADKHLIELCNGNPSAALWLSLYANQQIFAPFWFLFQKLPIKLIGDVDLNLNSGDISFAFSALAGGTVRLDVGYKWDFNNASKALLDEKLDKKMDFIICSNSEFSADFSLKFDLPTGDEMPEVSVLKPLEYQAHIFMVQLLPKELEMHAGDNSEIEIFVDETRQCDYSHRNAGDSPEYLDQDGQVDNELVRAVPIGVNESSSLGPEG